VIGGGKTALQNALPDESGVGPAHAFARTGVFG
jgi:hypothetical protein